MDIEHLCWLENEVFELVAPTGREKVFNEHYRFSIKSDDNKHVSRFKARYVLDGNSIEEKRDHSPVASIEASRALLAYAVKHKLHVH